MLVVDASVVAALLLELPGSNRLRLRLGNVPLHAPHLVDAEVAHVLRRHAAAGAVSDDRGGMLIDLLARFPITRHGQVALLPRAWDLRHNITAYDALYVALAEALDAPLLTLDRRLATAPGHYARVEVL